MELGICHTIETLCDAIFQEMCRVISTRKPQWVVGTNRASVETLLDKRLKVDLADVSEDTLYHQGNIGRMQYTRDGFTWTIYQSADGLLNWYRSYLAVKYVLPEQGSDHRSNLLQLFNFTEATNVTNVFPSLTEDSFASLPEHITYTLDSDSDGRGFYGSTSEHYEGRKARVFYMEGYEQREAVLVLDTRNEPLAKTLLRFSEMQISQELEQFLSDIQSIDT